jgi:hypothetical protein
MESFLISATSSGIKIMAATKTKDRHSKTREIKPQEVTTGQVDAMQGKLPPVAPVKTVYVITKDALHQYIGRQGQETQWDNLIKEIQANDNMPYIFYQSSKPFYMAVQNGTIQPLLFPEPKDYGTTSANLFAMAVTCADAIAEFIRLKIKGRQGLASQLRQLGVLGMPLVIAIFLIFILIVYIGGGGG